MVQIRNRFGLKKIKSIGEAVSPHEETAATLPAEWKNLTIKEKGMYKQEKKHGRIGFDTIQFQASLGVLEHMSPWIRGICCILVHFRCQICLLKS